MGESTTTIMTSTTGDVPYKKKLIEVALPLDAINAASAREKSIRHGHPSTLHLWWARRPLAACRAVLFSQLVDDPSAHPDQFPTEEEQDTERQRLFKIIEALVLWENTTNEEVLEAARAEIRRSCDGDPPPILDPFAGGGSIPLEAQRLGLEAHASDLNPVAVLINKALIEIPPKFADQPPVHPEAEIRTRWNGGEGLAEDVRRYGQWMRDEAEKRIGHLYPKATLPGGTEANVIAWIWARTVTCPNPACQATMPLVRSFWLGKKKGKEAWVKPICEGKTVRFEIRHDPSGPDLDGTVGRRGGICLCCDQPVKLDHIRTEGRAGRMGAELMAIAVEGDRRRIYLPPDKQHVLVAEVHRPDSVPSGDLPLNPRDFKTPNYGMTTWADLFTNRQLVTLTTFSDLITEARSLAESDAQSAGISPDQSISYANALATYLAFAISRSTNRMSTIVGWDSSPKMEGLRSVFARQALPMTWDYAEGNLFSNSSGNFVDNVGACADAIESCPAAGRGYTQQSDARDLNQFAAVSTDPPYYDNIGYADLSDYFYVWLRKSLRDIYPNLLSTMTTPKSEELIATPYRHQGSKHSAKDYFEHGFVDVFESARKTQVDNVPLTLFYAFKQTESTSDSGATSTGWSTMLEGLRAAGWSISATWPMRTELANKIGSGSNMLASSIVLACRPRPETAVAVDRRTLIACLEDELPSALRALQKAAVAPVDMRQAVIGPGMAIVSRFARVIEPDGSDMAISYALGLIHSVVESILDDSESHLDHESRWALQWYGQFLQDDAAYGEAEQLAVAMNVAIGAMVDSGIVKSGSGRVRLISRDELPDDWDPSRDNRIPIWEATQHLIKRLESDGEVAAARLFAQLQRRGVDIDACKALAYRLYDLAEGKQPELASPYNMLAASWPEVQRLARDAELAPQVVEQQSLDT